MAVIIKNENKNEKYKSLKSISQKYTPNEDFKELMDIFVKMVNKCIKIGLKENTHNRTKLTYLCYHELYNYDILGSYKISAISRAAGILSNRKQSIKRGVKVRYPKVKKPFITNGYDIKHNGCLMTIPYKNRQPINIILNEHTQKILSDDTITVQSFTMTQQNIGFCISKHVEKIECTDIVGIDRNLRNVTCGNEKKVIFYKTNKMLINKENTIRARAGFKRNDKRKKDQFWKIKQRRLSKRNQQYLHRVSKDIVDYSFKTNSVIVLEDLKGIRKLYQKGNGQGNKYRRRLNGWQFFELQRQIEYKARWVGLPVRYVDPKNTSSQCPRCGKKLQEDMQHSRKMSCNNCGLFMDRDVIAPINISRKLSPRFRDSRVGIGEAKSDTFESAMMEPSRTVIQIVDMSKSTLAV